MGSMMFILIALFLTKLSTCSKVHDKVIVELFEPKGVIQGHVLKTAFGKYYYAYQEIPYAAPPIGEKRFKPPEKHNGWEGILDATKNTKICVQHAFKSYNRTEDCLFINVYTPANVSENKIPVVVYFHGGSLIESAGIFQLFEPTYLMDYDVVVVTLNYRLGALGKNKMTTILKIFEISDS